MLTGTVIDYTTTAQHVWSKGNLWLIICHSGQIDSFCDSWSRLLTRSATLSLTCMGKSGRWPAELLLCSSLSEMNSLADRGLWQTFVLARETKTESTELPPCRGRLKCVWGGWDETRRDSLPQRVAWTVMRASKVSLLARLQFSPVGLKDPSTVS